MLGVPVLATDCTSIEELVKSGENGLVVDNSEEGLYFGIKEVIANEKLLHEFTENLKTYKYKNEKIIKRLNDLFDWNVM